MFETLQKTIPEMFGVHTVTLIPFKATSVTSSKEIALQDLPPREGTDHFGHGNFQEMYSENFLCEQVCQCGEYQVET